MNTVLAIMNNGHVMSLLANADAAGRVTPSTGSVQPRSRVSAPVNGLGTVLAFADAAGHVYAEWDESKQIRNEKGHFQGIRHPLYVFRPVENADEIIAWAKSVGFDTTLPAEGMHVTVCYSTEPVDWLALDHWDDTLEVPPEGVRTLAVWDESNHPRDEQGRWSISVSKGNLIRSWMSSPSDKVSAQLLSNHLEDISRITNLNRRMELPQAANKFKVGDIINLPKGLSSFADKSPGEEAKGSSITAGRLNVINKDRLRGIDLRQKSVLTEKEVLVAGHRAEIAKIWKNKKGAIIFDVKVFQNYADRAITNLGDDRAVALRFESAPL